MKNFAISTDSTSDFTYQEAKDLCLYIGQLDFTITENNQLFELKDDFKTNDEYVNYYNRLRKGGIAKTSILNVQAHIDLFTEMGYGSSSKIIKKSKGFNIEGVFSEDVLGLDDIYLRVKHHKRRKIYREDMEDYVKYLKSNKIQKGIFVTITSFDYEALKYANRVKENIVLIDLEKLVNLMIRFKVGVNTKEILEINEIDDDYF